METTDLIYQTIQFFFSTFWIYIGLLLFVLTIKGDVTRAIQSVSKFFSGIKAKYREGSVKEKLYQEYKKQKTG